MKPRPWAILAGVLCLLASGLSQAQGRDVSRDAADITAQMKHDFEKPDHPLLVSPVVAVDDWALAGWTQGDMGGRALLRYRDGAWVIWLCAGDGIRAVTALRDAGLPQSTAERLASASRAAEARESADRIALFSRFSGVVPMAAGNEAKR